MQLIAESLTFTVKGTDRWSDYKEESATAQYEHHSARAKELAV